MQRIEESSAFLEEIRPIAEEAEQAEEKKDGIQVEEIEIGK